MNMLKAMDHTLSVLDTASTGRQKRLENTRIGPYVADVPLGAPLNADMNITFHVQLGNVEIDICELCGNRLDFESLPEYFKEEAIAACWEVYDDTAQTWEDE